MGIPFTQHEIDVLKAKGWSDFGETCAFHNWQKVSKYYGKFNVYTLIDDGEGGYWDEWADSSYDTVEEVDDVSNN